MNLAAEWGPSPDNQTNSLTIAASYNMWKGIALSGQFHYGSARTLQTRPARIRSACPESRQDLHRRFRLLCPASCLASNAPAGYQVVNRDCFVGQQIARIDVRLSKTFTLKERFKFIPMIERTICSITPTTAAIS